MRDQPASMIRGALRATATAIAIDAPHHSRSIRALLKRSPASRNPDESDQDVGDSCELDLPHESVTEIHSALQRVRERHGNHGKFRGYEINYLILLWQRAIQPE